MSDCGSDAARFAEAALSADEAACAKTAGEVTIAKIASAVAMGWVFIMSPKPLCQPMGTGQVNPHGGPFIESRPQQRWTIRLRI